MKTASEENDKDTEQFLQWFVKEQIEEEAAPARILRKIRDAAERGEKDLGTVDKELANRN